MEGREDFKISVCGLQKIFGDCVGGDLEQSFRLGLFVTTDVDLVIEKEI